MGKDKESQRDHTKAAEKMAERRERDARTEDENGWAVTGKPDRPSHPNGWQTGGRKENS